MDTAVEAGMDTFAIVGALEDGMGAAERILLRVEELELLIGADRPRRLIDMAQGELAEAIAGAERLWGEQGRELVEVASTATDPEVSAAWGEFAEMLALSSRRASEASALIASRLLAAQDAIDALDEHREYGRDGGLHLLGSGESGVLV